MDGTHLLELVRYIHLNPLRAGLVADLSALDDYAWSGHGVIMGNGEMVGVASNDILALCARSRGEAKRRYRQFVADGVAQGKRDDLTSSGKRRTNLPEDPYDDRIMGSGDFIEELRMRRELAPELSAIVKVKNVSILGRARTRPLRAGSVLVPAWIGRFNPRPGSSSSYSRM